MCNDYLEDFFAHSSDLMIVVDASGHVVRANQSFLSMFGHSESAIKGRPLTEFTCSDDRTRLGEFLAKVASGGKPEQISVRCIVREEATAYCSYTLRAARDDNRYLLIGRNLDAWYKQCTYICWERQATEQLINERTRELQLANADMEAFSFSISHDLRAPVRVIRGLATAIAEDHMNDLGATSRDYLRRILANCEHMTTLTDYLLELARMSHQELQYKKVDLGQMADTIIADMKMIEPERDVSYSRHGCMVAEGDDELLFTLMQNLLGNAWKYTAKRSKAHIELSSKQVNGEMVFSVTDNGVGYPLAQQEQLFVLFRRLHDPSEYAGLGVGLPTAKRIVQRHGGRIWSECIENEMTAFHFTLSGTV